MYRLVDPPSGYLFSSRELRVVLEAQTSAMRAEVDSLDANRLLNTAPADLAAYFAEKFRIEPLVLHTDKWTVDESECQVDVSGDSNRFWFEKPSGPGPHSRPKDPGRSAIRRRKGPFLLSA